MMRTFTLSLALAAILVAAVTVTASAQTSTTSSGNLTTAAPSATSSGVKRPPTSATAEMVNEAIQRSEARAAKARAAGITEQWGTEEPFTYNPTVRRFNANQQ